MHNCYSLYCSPYISYGTSKKNLSKCQDILSLLGDHFLYSDYLNVLTSSGNVKRNFIFITVLNYCMNPVLLA